MIPSDGFIFYGNGIYREIILPYRVKKKFPLLKVYRNITIINKPNDAKDTKSRNLYFFSGKQKKSPKLLCFGENKIILLF